MTISARVKLAVKVAAGTMETAPPVYDSPAAKAEAQSETNFKVSEPSLA